LQFLSQKNPLYYVRLHNTTMLMNITCMISLF